MKTVAMIPARLGSKRVHNKNLRLIGGKPLIAYMIEAVIDSGVFKLDEIYLNSESDVFRHIADDYGINFYHRDPKFSTDKATNDEFVHDFISNVSCNVIFQFLPTSPFTAPADIREFYDKMCCENIDTLISTTDIQIGCLYKNEPINFKQKEKLAPSQSLEPVKAYSCGMMAWDCEKFKENIKVYKSGYHGGNGRTAFFSVGGFASVDIDTVDDFVLAERILESVKYSHYTEPEYYDPDLHSGVRSEIDVPTILEKDGVKSGNYSEENKSVVNVEEMLEKNPNDSWMHRLVNTESNSCCVIHQNPGEGNRRHYHPSWNEWWYILKGEWEFDIENKKTIVRKGDLVFIPKNKWHKITCIGSEPAARLAVSRADVSHVYER